MENQNNKVFLKGIVSNEVKLLKTKEENLFVAFSMATQESYLAENGKSVKSDPIWHNNILIFDERLIETAKSLKKLDKVTLTGQLSYRSFPFQVEGKTISKQEVSIIGKSLELNN